MIREWIGVDLDGTLAEHREWRGPTHIGAPIPKMVARVKQWLADGEDVRIFTARVGGHQTAAEVAIAQEAIRRWCHDHIGQVLPITAEKDYDMVALWDDLAVQVVPNTGIAVREELDRCRRDVNRLNNALRAAGWGQGEIDTYADLVDKIDKLAGDLEETNPEVSRVIRAVLYP